MAKQRRGSITFMINRLSRKLMIAIAASAAVSILAMIFVVYETNQFLSSTKTASKAVTVLEDGLEARVYAYKYRLAPDEKLVENFDHNIHEVIEFNNIIREEWTLEPEALEALNASDRQIAEYAESFAQLVALRAPIEAQVNTLAETGTRVRQHISEIMEKSLASGDSASTATAGLTQKHLMLGRLYIERFVNANDPADFERAMKSFAEATKGTNDLLRTLGAPASRTLAENSRAGLAELIAASTEAERLIGESNARLAHLDVVGPQFIKSIEFVLEGIAHQQELIGSYLSNVGLGVMVLLLSSAIAVQIYANRSAQKTASYVSTAIDKFVHAMTELANGKLEIDLGRPPDEGSELARMAEALGIFRDNAIERIELQKKQAEQEKEQAAEREAQIKRDEAAKVEAQRQIDAERHQLLTRLEESVGTVVSNAADGDFSHRINVDFDEESLRNMANGINHLMQSVEEGLGATTKIMAALSKGDLSNDMSGSFKGAFKDLQDDTNAMIAALQSLIGDISGSTLNLSGSSNELRDASNSLSKQAEQNAASLEETSAALEELTASIKQVSENVNDANNHASIASETAKSSGAVAADAAEAMNRISDASKEIATVVTAINDIAFQINLLALNAGVEAARAGEAGQGFSVVASEVRSLAQRAGEAAQEIDAVIERSDVAVSEGVAKVTDAQQSLEKIAESVVGVSERIDQVTVAISEQVSGIGEINSAVAQIDHNTQKQAASFEEVTASSRLLSNEADGLKKSTARFKTKRSGAASASQPAAKASHSVLKKAG